MKPSNGNSEPQKGCTPKLGSAVGHYSLDPQEMEMLLPKETSNHHGINPSPISDSVSFLYRALSPKVIHSGGPRIGFQRSKSTGGDHHDCYHSSNSGNPKSSPGGSTSSNTGNRSVVNFRHSGGKTADMRKKNRLSLPSPPHVITVQISDEDNVTREPKEQLVVEMPKKRATFNPLATPVAEVCYHERFEPFHSFDEGKSTSSHSHHSGRRKSSWITREALSTICSLNPAPRTLSADFGISTSSTVLNDMTDFVRKSSWQGEHCMGGEENNFPCEFKIDEIILSRGETHILKTDGQVCLSNKVMHFVHIPPALFTCLFCHYERNAA